MVNTRDIRHHENGIPEWVVSDNGPQFASAGSAHFANTWGLIHATPSPRYPQSNGLAEKELQIAQRIIMKAAASRRDTNLQLRQKCQSSKMHLGWEQRTAEVKPGRDRAAVVTGRANTPRSYNFTTEDDAIHRRNTQHLNKPSHYTREGSRTAKPDQWSRTAKPDEGSRTAKPDDRFEPLGVDFQATLSDGPPLQSRYGWIYRHTIVHDV